MASKKSAQRTIHFIGIGGIGMSALARWFLANRWIISGSDINESDITKKLRTEGVAVQIGHRPENLPHSRCLVVCNQAISAKNSEIILAKKRGLVIKSYPEAIGELTKKYRTIAIAGSHGKSTTTALVSLVLIHAGLIPDVIVGTLLKEWGNTNFIKGKGEYLVLEADEFGRAFWHYSPSIALITNIDKEHLDTYKDLDGVKKSFLKFIGNIQTSGILVVNKEDKNLRSLGREIHSICKAKNIKVFWYAKNSVVANFIRSNTISSLPGWHNVSNASGAYALGMAMGLRSKTILKGISKFKGTWRRLEYRGRFFNSPIFDDYAHHPTEIKATLFALREKYPDKKIVCVFQPHQIERLKLLFKEFAESFKNADALVLLDVYKVSGREQFPDTSVMSSQNLADVIQKNCPRKSVSYLKNSRKIFETLELCLRGLSQRLQSPAIVMMGAGDIINYADKLISNSKKVA